MILNAKIDLDKVKGVWYKPDRKLKNGHRFILFDIDESFITVDEYGVHLSMDIVEKGDKAKSWGFIKEHGSKDMTLDEKKALPFIGNAWEQKPKDANIQETMNPEGGHGIIVGDDDLPF